MPPEVDEGPLRFVMISGYHDYRSKRRANLHFITDSLANRGSVFFLSLRYSHVTRFTEDPRHDLWDLRNRVQSVGNVSCYLWQTVIHPFRLPHLLAPVERILFKLFAKVLPRPAKSALALANIIIIESGIALIYLPLIRRLAPAAQVIYLASDSLAAINQAESIRQAFQRHAHLIDGARLPSPRLRCDVPASIPCYFVPHGIEKQRFSAIGPSPYHAGTCNAVSVGSMLFDPVFFEIAAPLFPDMTFHVIGSGRHDIKAPNVVVYPEMPFEATLPFIKHANFAIAPYGEGVAPYLSDTSMKLMQYGYLGIPAVCPESVASGQPGRFGYVRNSASSIANAIRLACACVRPLSVPDVMDWDQVVDNILAPPVSMLVHL